jgi:hypothetical protein
MNRTEATYDPETIELMRDTLETAWSQLSPDSQARWSKTELAVRILKAAANGERDPARLCAHALTRVVSGM